MFLKAESEDIFGQFVKPVRRLIEERGFLTPTEPQKKTIPKILEGKNVLLISPTATGKTESAVLPILNTLIQMPDRRPGIKVLYVTPLRALNRDLLDRLQWWCNNLDIKLAVRHGDTETKERTRQSRSPPDILITTPETLQAVLIGWVLRQHLQHVRWVVIDEVHEMAESKRGSQLSLALERLRSLVRDKFQMIGLSATIGSPEKVARFLVGNDETVEIIKVPVARRMQLEIVSPEPTSEDLELASSLYTHPEVAARLRIIKDCIKSHRSALLFTNTRTISEVLASRFKIWDVDFPVSIHHGSLAKPSRVAAESGLKSGELKGLVCTSSLELGIDIGRIDLVVQYMSPRQVTRFIQRIGRSGHRVGRIAKGIVITMDSDDTLESMAICRMAYDEELEPVKIPEKPYDALAHQIAGLLMKRRRLFFGDILDLFKRAYPYRNLTMDDIQKILTYMHSRFPRFAWVSFEDATALRPRRSKALYEYYFDNLSMIPVQKQYLVIDESSDTAIGILDEAFTAEYGKPGVKFIIRGSPWKIIHVYGDKIYVKSVDDPTGAIPSWVGEEIPVPYEVSQEVGKIRRLVEQQSKNGVSNEKIVSKLTQEYPASKDTISRTLQETFEQISRGHPVPTDDRITIEDWEDLVIIHANLGSLTNRALAQLLGHFLSDRTGHTVAVQHDPYRVFIQAMGATNAENVVDLFNEFKGMSEAQIRDAVAKSTVKTGLFKRRMIHVSRRFGALKKWADFSTVSLNQLLKSFEGTAIYDEALKETFTKDIDVERLLQVIGRLRMNELSTAKVDNLGRATPVARVGIERVSMRTDLIPSERMRLISVESARARLLNEVRSFVCTQCWDYLQMIRIKDLPSSPKCPKCDSPALGLLRREENKVRPLVEKKGERLTKAERKMHQQAEESARLIAQYGKSAAIALSARRINADQVQKILSREQSANERFFELVVEAEREALKRRFWA
ncbi:MAG: DEAD/DEAH box helicase [Candidatus Bathyarchaeota archaeon]|nr:MAG: DEAD/DEAH box helicase [Candidatus Bathyarchaeota archaeon]